MSSLDAVWAQCRRWDDRDNRYAAPIGSNPRSATLSDRVGSEKRSEADPDGIGTGLVSTPCVRGVDVFDDIRTQRGAS
jgi:hypothetical protein